MAQELVLATCRYSHAPDMIYMGCMTIMWSTCISRCSVGCTVPAVIAQYTVLYATGCLLQFVTPVCVLLRPWIAYVHKGLRCTSLGCVHQATNGGLLMSRRHGQMEERMQVGRKVDAVHC